MDSGRAGIGTHNLGHNLNPTSYMNQPVIQALQNKSWLFNLQKNHVLLSRKEGGSGFNRVHVYLIQMVVLHVCWYKGRKEKERDSWLNLNLKTKCIYVTILNIISKHSVWYRWFNVRLWIAIFFQFCIYVNNFRVFYFSQNWLCVPVTSRAEMRKHL